MSPAIPTRPAFRHGPLTLRHSIGTRRHGMTLLELIVVIVILGILAAIAIPVFLAVIQKSQDALAINTLEEFSHQAYIDASANQVVGYDNPSIDTSAASTNITAATLAASAAQSKTSLYIPPPTTDSPPQPGVSYAYGVVSAGFVNSGATLSDPSTITASLTPAPALYTAMKSTSGHCVKLITQAGNVIGSQVTTTGACQSVGTAALTTGTPPPAPGGTSTTTTTGSGAITLTGTAGDASVDLSFTAVAAATSYQIACPQDTTIGSLTSTNYGSITTTVTPTGTATAPTTSSGPAASGTYTPPAPLTSGSVTLTIAGLANFVVAHCTVTGVTSSTPVVSNTLSLTPSAPSAFYSTCPDGSPIPASGTCSVTAEPPPPPATIPPGTAATPTTFGPGSITSIASNDNSFPHEPFVADPATGAIYQVQVTSDGTGSPRVMFPAGSFVHPSALLAGMFANSSNSVTTNVFYVADSGTGDIWRVDPNSFLVNSSGYQPPTKTLVASGLTGVTGLAGYTCYTGSNTPATPASGVPQECLYAIDAAGVEKISLNNGSVALLSTPYGGSWTSITLQHDLLALTSSTTGVWYVYPATGALDYHQNVADGSQVVATASSGLGQSGETWDTDGTGGGAASVTTSSSIIYTDTVTNVVGALDATGQSTVLAGGGSTPVNTSTWTSCADASFDHPTAVHYHGPKGLLFIGESGNGNFDMLETAQYVIPGSDSPIGTCRVKALFGNPAPGGANWTQSTPTLLTGGNNSVSCAPGTKTCVAVGSVYQSGYVTAAMYSNDNGVTWTRSSSSNLAAASNLTSVSCVTASFCVAVGSPAAGANPGIALYTTNGGLDWTVGSQSGLPDPTTISGKFNSVSCASTQDCVAVGNYYTTANPSSYTSTTAYYTTDGGLDWGDGPVPTAGTHCDSDGYSGCTFYSVSCVPGGSLCVAIGTASATSVESYSDDNGATWTSSTDPYTWGTTGYYGNWMVAADVSCPAADLCMLNYQGGEYSQTASTLLSTDGGVTWSGGGNGTPGIPTSFFCLSTSLCIQGGHGASQWGDDGSGAYSVDGGNNWIYSNFTNNPSWLGLNSISCTGVYACVALGNDNYVYLSN